DGDGGEARGEPHDVAPGVGRQPRGVQGGKLDYLAGHCCTAPSIALAAPRRSAAPRSRVAWMLARVLSLICCTAPSIALAAPGRSAAPRSRGRLDARARSVAHLLHRSLTRARRSGSLACASLQGRLDARARSVAHLLHRSLTRARGSGSLGCASLQGRLDARARSVAHWTSSGSMRLCRSAGTSSSLALAARLSTRTHATIAH